MGVKLFFIFALLLLFNTNAYCSCKGIIDSIEICEKYVCRQYIGNENFIEHRILGFNSKGLCVYVEKQNNNEMICYHSKYGMLMEKKYFENVFKVDNQKIMVNFIDVTSLRAKECFFINDRKINHPDQDEIIKEATESDSDVLSQFNDIKSIFFDEEPINKIVSEMGKFHQRSSGISEVNILNNFDCKVVSLDSILYFSSDVWRIWVNKRLFSNTKDLKIHSVNENYVTFVWTVDQYMIKKQVRNDSRNVYLSEKDVVFTLYPGQKFDLDSLSIS
ncbi:MAG: hypothetical protein LKM44_02820 [Wolbachia endosymbiont of Meromenopon meropis]|nr:hypothetical protein [Wolbachia endosymbiont of Meromenopon meropis]